MRFLWPSVVGMGLAALAALTSSACSSSKAEPSPAAGTPDAADAGETAEAGEVADAADAGTDSPVAARPFALEVPKNYVAGKATPLLVSLHGYGSSAMEQEDYLGFKSLAQSKTFLYAYPDGTKNFNGDQFWNANDACCGFGGTTVDDVAYITAVIDDVSARYEVDPARIWIFGHSNGGFMAHRLACDLSTRVAAIVSLAGAVWKDDSKCTPTGKVSVLQIHGDKDGTISYAGGSAANLGGPAHPSAAQTAATWAKKNGCTGQLAPKARYDLAVDLDGDETRAEAYAGCPAGVGVELWTIEGGPHIPKFSAGWRERMFSFLSEHPKP